MSAAIEATGLTREFEGRAAVDRVTLQIEPGEIFGFLGPNGSGKTTTIRMLTGRLKPSAGTAVVLGHTLPKARDKLYAHIGVVGDRPTVYERLSARQNLMIFARLHGVPARRVDALLERFGLADRAKDAVKTFSLGMRQKLLLARAFLSSPDLLFLDEPTRGLDPHAARLLREVIREENARGCTVFLTTHYMDEADSLCDRVGLIVDGRLVAADAPDALKRQNAPHEMVVTCRDGRQTVLPLDAPDTSARMAQLLAGGDVVDVRTPVPTLEQVFMDLTGQALDRAAS